MTPTRLTWRRPARRAWRRYLALQVLLVTGYLLLPGGLVQDGVYLAVGLSSVTAVVAGVAGHRPERPWSWRLLAGGLLLWVAADAVYAYLQHVAHVEPFPSAADVLYLLAYPVLAAGLVVLVRARERGIDTGALVDSAIVTIAAGLLSWVCLARPVVAAGGRVTATVVSVAYPAADVVLLGLLVHLVIVPGARTPSFRLLVAATGLLLVADTVYAVSTATGGDGGVLANLGWMGQYVLAGTAALHPSMRELSRRGTERTPPVTTRRLAALTVAVLVAPGTLAVQLLRGGPVTAWAVVIGSVALFLLVVVRMQAALREVVLGARQRERLQDDLAHQAAHDPLTELANRARVLELVEAALHRARRHGAAVGLLFLDLDHFKAVNDTLGHRAGDEVLRTAAARLRQQVRAGDTVGRLGGDEFVVLVEAPDGPAELVGLAQRLVDALARPVVVAGREVVVGASVGVALGVDGGTDASQLLHHADAAAYRAKARGRGRAEVFDEALRAELEHRAELERALRHALVAGELVLHYQPVVELATQRVTGHEALVRWQRPGHGLVPPDEFVPTAELSGLVCDLGRWVLLEATAQLAAWRREDPERYGGSTVAVNVSGRHLLSAELVDDVTAALAAAGLPPSGLVLEITETVLVDQRTAGVHLQALRALGVGISIDDFGTGYTSIGQLRHLQADTLKIDRSFVGAQDEGGRALIGLMVQAAHAFGLTVVAEGIETAEQVEPLRRLACDAAQGYLFARPQPAEALGRTDARQP